MEDTSQGIRFFVQGLPKAQPRPRFTSKGWAYTPATAKEWKKAIVLKIKASPWYKIPDHCRVELRVTFILPRPKAHFRGKRKCLRDDSPECPTSKPDLDNLEKAVMDAITDSGLWHDDSMVTRKLSCKEYSADGDATGADIAIEWFPNYSSPP